MINILFYPWILINYMSSCQTELCMIFDIFIVYDIKSTLENKQVWFYNSKITNHELGKVSWLLLRRNGDEWNRLNKECVEWMKNQRARKVNDQQPVNSFPIWPFLFFVHTSALYITNHKHLPPSNQIHNKKTHLQTHTQQYKDLTFEILWLPYKFHLCFPLLVLLQKESIPLSQNSLELFPLLLQNQGQAESFLRNWTAASHTQSQ